MKRLSAKWGWLALPAIALVWKGVWLYRGAFPFNADEAIVALMARHILHGERPIFFYGQAYMGSLDAFLVAAAFALLGQKVVVIRLVQALLYAATVVLTAFFTLRLTQKPLAAWLTGLLLAIPTVNMTLYTTVSLGGYGEALLIGTGLLLISLMPWPRTRVGAFCFGFLFGLGLWAFGFVLVYAVPATLFLWFVRWRGVGARLRSHLLLALVLGLVLGAFPWWWYGVVHGWAPLLRELTGSAVAVEHGSWLSRSLKHGFMFVVFGLPVALGLRPPWGVEVLVPPLAAVALSVYGFWAVTALRGRKAHHDKNWWLVWGVVLTLTFGFIFSSFGTDPSGRYFLPVTQMLSVGLGAFFANFSQRLRSVGLGGVALLLLFHALSTGQAASNPYRLTTQFAPDARLRPGFERPLEEFLEAHHLERGYTNYWVAYPLAFLSGERLIFIPRLPYHEDLRYTPRDDRYPAYDRLVVAAARVAYITTGQRRLEERLRSEFRLHGITWQEQKIGDYRVFYDLSSPIAPWEMGISPPPTLLAHFQR